MISLLVSLRWMVALLVAAALVFAAARLIEPVLSFTRRIVIVAMRLVAAALVAVLGGLTVTLVAPALLDTDVSLAVIAGAVAAGLACGAITWSATRRWGLDAEPSAPTRSRSEASVCARGQPSTPVDRNVPVSPLLDPSQERRMLALQHSLEEMARRDPLDTAVSEWCAVCGRVPDLIRSTEAVYADAAPDDRRALRAGLSHDLESIIAGGEARLHASRRSSSMMARDRLAMLRRYVAARTGSTSLS